MIVCGNNIYLQYLESPSFVGTTFRENEEKHVGQPLSLLGRYEI